VIVELGHFALVLAVIAALIQTVIPLYGAHVGDRRLMTIGSTAAVVQFALIAASFLALTAAFVASDFSVAAVVANSHTTKPLIYKISGVWGNHEGSMLLWVLMVALFGAAVALFGQNLPDTLKARVLAVQASIALAFGIFILATSNPFARMFPPPVEGQGLNPILQDPALAFTPRFSTPATSASRSPTRSRLQRSSRGARTERGGAGSGRGRWLPGCA
jgi:cytochrome c-type biogenesis protein CcmF